MKNQHNNYALLILLLVLMNYFDGDIAQTQKNQFHNVHNIVVSLVVSNNTLEAYANKYAISQDKPQASSRLVQHPSNT